MLAGIWMVGTSLCSNFAVNAPYSAALGLDGSFLPEKSSNREILWASQAATAEPRRRLPSWSKGKGTSSAKQTKAQAQPNHGRHLRIQANGDVAKTIERCREEIERMPRNSEIKASFGPGYVHSVFLVKLLCSY